MLRPATALQLGGLLTVKGDPKIPLEAFKTSSMPGFIAYTSVPLVALFNSLPAVFLQVHCTSDHFTFSSSALFNPLVYLMLQNLTKIKLTFAEEPYSKPYFLKKKSLIENQNDSSL